MQIRHLSLWTPIKRFGSCSSPDSRCCSDPMRRDDNDGPDVTIQSFYVCNTGAKCTDIMPNSKCCPDARRNLVCSNYVWCGFTIVELAEVCPALCNWVANLWFNLPRGMHNCACVFDTFVGNHLWRCNLKRSIGRLCVAAWEVLCAHCVQLP